MTLIKNKLIEEKLLINKKSNICNLKNGFSFIGYTFKIKYNTLWIRYNNKAIRRISKRLRRNKGKKYSLYYKSKLSYNGYLKNVIRGKFYKSFDEDAIIINYLFGYQLINNKVGFPMEVLFKVKGKLKNNKVGYVILNGNDVISETVEKNNYHKLLQDGYNEYNKQIKIEEILNLIKLELTKDINLYDKLKELLEQRKSINKG